MNDRERILTLFAGRTPDRVPWFGDLDYWASAMEARGQVPNGWRSSPDYMRLHRELGIGFYLQGYFAFEPVTEGDVTITEQREGHVRHTIVQTPLGALHDEWRYLPESCAWAPVRHMVNTVSDLAILRYWWERTSYRSAEAEAIRRRPLIGDLGVVLCYLPRSPFMQLNVELAGIANIVNLWMEAPDEFEETLDVMAATSDRAAELAVATPADCLMIPENLSSEVVGRRFYDRYVAPWEHKWVQRIHAAGKNSFIHMDGTLRGLIARVAQTGFQVIEAVTPQPVGDATLRQARELAGPGPILWGGLPGIYFTPLVSDAEFERHTREVLETMVADRRMVLGVADQVPPDGTRARMAKVVELVERYGRYR